MHRHPEDFKVKVPVGAVALAGAIVSKRLWFIWLIADSLSLQIQNCLDEFQDGEHKKKSFTADDYTQSYLAVKGAVKEIRMEVNYHGPDLERNLVRWAQAGR